MNFVCCCVLSWMRHVIICLDGGGESVCVRFTAFLVCEDRTDASASFFLPCCVVDAALS